MESTIKVQVAGSVKEYPADITGYGDHLAAGGQTVSLFEARRQAKVFFRNRYRDQMVRSLVYWVTMDDSGLAYRVEINRTNHHQVMAASPLPGPNNVRELYVA